jgi:hypothetical protein
MMFVYVQLGILDIHVMSLNIPNVMLILPLQLYTKGAMELIVKLTFTPSKDSIHALSTILPLKPLWITFFSAEV